MIDPNVVVRMFIGNVHIMDKAIDPSGFGSWPNTLKYIREQLEAVGHSFTSEEIKAGIYKNNGFEFSHNATDNPCQQRRFEIHRTGDALNAVA